MVRTSATRFLAVGSAILILATAACGGANTKSSKAANGAAAVPQRTEGVAASAAATSAASSAPRAASAAAQPAGAAAAASASGSQATGPASSLGSQASLDRKIIRNADLAVEVKDPEAAIDSVTSIATGLGGYITNSKLSRSDDILRGTIAMRVPATQFDTAMFELKKLGTKVTRENVTGQDVTEEYTDLDARIRNLESTADQLRQLQATIREKTGRVEDVLSVYNQLSNVTGQIEQAKGRQNALSQLSDMATISLELSPPPVVQAPKPEPKPEPKHAWTLKTTLEDAVTALSTFGQGLLQALIWIAILVVPIAAGAGILILTARYANRRWRTAP